MFGGPRADIPLHDAAAAISEFVVRGHPHRTSFQLSGYFVMVSSAPLGL
jgi:hypothetical protein